MKPSMRRRGGGVVVGLVVLLSLLVAAPATAGLEVGGAEELAQAEAAEVRAFLQELFAEDPGQAGEWEWEPAPPATREMRFPSGEALPVVAGPVGPGDKHYDPNEAGLPLLDVSGDNRATKLAPDVTAGELAHSGSRDFDVARIDPNLVACLQQIRSALDEPVEVTSGYRSYAYNVELYRDRGEEPTDSQHSSGRAMDVNVDGMSGLDVARAAVEVCGCELGVGVGDDFAHVDVRGTESHWSYLDDDPARDALDALGEHRAKHCGEPADDADENEDESPDPAAVPATNVGVTPGALLAAPDEVVDGLREALRSQEFTEAVELAVANGLWHEDQLTDMVFFVAHPDLGGRPIKAGEDDLARAWLRTRDDIVRPALADVPAFIGMPAASLADPPGPVRSTSWLRRAWDGHECQEEIGTIPTDVLGNRVGAHPWTVEALGALETALDSTGYEASSVGIYNCRDIRGSPGKRSLHAFGLAVDLDPGCHPHRVGARGPARFSSGSTQEQRCRDVRSGFADTAFTPEQVEAVESIRTVDGLQVFTWGGRWKRSPDAMHFQINVSPDELLRGLD